ncbi:hypothetical protein MNBD_GAMMA01-381 [hydrothermal vent metagenome]|uniref:Uncharacterized protein n=1 Tax=hydrothermal vent metagenome TaxID=652676 RepID=A0A3B0VYY6_9ZZZZ
MSYKNLLILLICLSLLNACATNSNNKNRQNNIRTEQVAQVSTDSAEMKNVELGVGYLKRGREDDLDIALEKFKKAVGYNPKFALAHSMLANVYDKKGLFDSAKKHYKLSIKYNNGSPDIINNYANFLCQRGSYDLAIKKYLQVINNPQYKTPASAYENAGICSYKDNKISQAEGYFRQALALNNKQANSLYYLMLINKNREHYMQALAFLQRLEQVVQPSSEILAAGYQIEKELGNIELANKYLTTLQTKFPNSESLENIK